MTTSTSFTTISLEDKFSRYLIVVSLISFLAILQYVFKNRPNPALPTINIERKSFLSKLLPAKLFWMKDAPGLIEKGNADFNGPFQVPTSSGYKVVLPQRFAEEIRNNPDLSFNEAFMKDFFTGYPGFEAFTEGLKDGTWLQEVVRVKLTQSLGLITEDLVDETEASLHDICGEDPNYHAVVAKENILDIVARLSSRVFLGKTLCRNEEWLDITKNHTVDLFKGAQLMRMVPGPIRPLVYRAIAPCRRLRAQVASARKLILGEVKLRTEKAQKALDAGQKPPKQADAIAWMVECARGEERDLVAAQLSLSMAAIHTTSETTLNVILQLCETPELTKELRDEIIEVLSAEGWSKQTLYKLRLMDSVLRECSRVRGMACTSMNRHVQKELILSDGTVLPAGSRILVHDSKGNNEKSFPNPERFEPRRFLDLRNQPGEENRHQLVTPTNDHMTFGYGTHACPGRFFAANEIKVLLCFFLLKYDVRYIEENGAPKKPRYFTFESARMSDPKAQIEIRRRQEEIDLLEPKIGKKGSTM